MSPDLFDLLVTCAAVLLAGIVLRFQLWRALAFLFPAWLRLEVDAPSDQMALPEALRGREEALLGLGYQPLGRHLERRPLGPSWVVYDYGSPTEATFALLLQPEGGAPRLTFLTPTERGGFVLTSDHRRPSRRVTGRYEGGGLEGGDPLRVHRAHRRRLEAFSPAPPFSVTVESCVETLTAWHAQWGAAELRPQYLFALLWSLGSLGMVAIVLLDRFGR